MNVQCLNTRNAPFSFLSSSGLIPRNLLRINTRSAVYFYGEKSGDGDKARLSSSISRLSKHTVSLLRGIKPERTLKRRFKTATGSSLIEYLQNLRIEEAKHLLESGQMPVDDISAAAGYEDPSFFRRLFKRNTGLTPSLYRRMFQPILKGTSINPGLF